jgi:hypothetical protein
MEYEQHVQNPEQSEIPEEIFRLGKKELKWGVVSKDLVKMIGTRKRRRFSSSR